MKNLFKWLGVHKKYQFNSCRLLFLILLNILVLTLIPFRAEASGKKFTYSDAEEAKRLALECFMTCGFIKEYDDVSSESDVESTLHRWEETIKINVSGTPEKDDFDELNGFIMECATHCPNMPNIRIVKSRKQANVTVWYGPLDQLQYHIKGYITDNWAFSHYTYDNGHMTQGEIVIANDIATQEEKNHMLRDMLLGVFGLTNHQDVYNDSIIFEEWNTTQKLSDLDWLMLNMLYDPDLECSMSADEAYIILDGKISK